MSSLAVDLLEWRDYPPCHHSSQVFCAKQKSSAVISYFLDFLVQHPEELLLTLRGVDAPAGKRCSGAGQRQREKSFRNSRNLQNLPVWTGFIQELVFTKECTFFLEEKVKSKSHLLITKKTIKCAVHVLLVMWEGRAPCCLSHPLLPHLRWGTWFSPLLSSCTHLWERERSATPVNARRAAHLTQRTTCSRPRWWEQLYWFWEFSAQQSDYASSQPRLNQQLETCKDEAECPSVQKVEPP